MLEIGTWLNNTFDTCQIIGHQDDPKYRVLKCRNIMNEFDNHFVYNEQVSMCQNHVCAVVDDITDLTHATLTCSGAIFSFQGDRFFNPINIFEPILSELVEFPGTNFDFFSNDFKYYYIKDSRTTFSQNIETVNCTNDFSTCVSFEDGSSFCMGNVKDILIIHPMASFILGVCIALIFVSIVFLTLRSYTEYFRNIVMVFIYSIPLVGMTLILTSVLAITTTAYIIGNILVMLAFPLVTNYVERFFDKYIN